jgi:putative oxidoreductase
MLGSVIAACDRALALVRRVGWIGPLLVRMTLGLVFVTTGWGKLHNLDNVAQFFGSLHIPAPHANAVFVSLVELGGGALLIVGLGTRIAALFLIGVMAVAIWTARLPELHGIVDLANTIELAYLAACVWLVVGGGGAASADHALARWMKHGSSGAAPTDARAPA